MMEYLIKWVKNIAIFYIISTLVQNLVLDGKYLKYIKLFLGIVMVILLIRPLGELIGATDDYNKIYLQAGVDEMSAELKAGLEAADEERSRIVVGEYTDRIKSDIQEYVTGLGAGYKDSSVTIDTDAASDTFGQITGITVNVTRESAYDRNHIDVDKIVIDRDPDDMNEELLSIRIKNYLSDFYNLSKRNIYVNIV